MLDLQRGMLDAETRVQHLLELLPDPMAIGISADEDMSGKRGKATRHSPHM